MNWSKKPEIFWVQVNNSNRDILEKWKGSAPVVDGIVGLAKFGVYERIEKGTSPKGMTKNYEDTAYGYNFGDEISFEEFKFWELDELPREWIVEINNEKE